MMTKLFPKESRKHAIWVAEYRDPDVTIALIAKEFGVHVETLGKLVRQAEFRAG